MRLLHNGTQTSSDQELFKAVEQGGHRSRSCDFERKWGKNTKGKERRQRHWAVVELERGGGKKEDIPQLITENETNSGGKQTVI